MNGIIRSSRYWCSLRPGLRYKPVASVSVPVPICPTKYSAYRNSCPPDTPQWDGAISQKFISLFIPSRRLPGAFHALAKPLLPAACAFSGSVIQALLPQHKVGPLYTVLFDIFGLFPSSWISPAGRHLLHHRTVYMTCCLCGISLSQQNCIFASVP